MTQSQLRSRRQRKQNPKYTNATTEEDNTTKEP